MATEAEARAFFSSPNFAVIGASNDPKKFGHKIFSWYLQHSLPTTPINPSSAVITTTSPAAETATLPSLTTLPSPTTTSLSIITPPRATLKILQEAKDLGIPAVWLQPGTFDDESLGFAQREFKAAVGGEGGAGAQGWCVLVDGERALEAAGRGRL